MEEKKLINRVNRRRLRTYNLYGRRRRNENIFSFAYYKVNEENLTSSTKRCYASPFLRSHTHTEVPSATMHFPFGFESHVEPKHNVVSIRVIIRGILRFLVSMTNAHISHENKIVFCVHIQEDQSHPTPVRSRIGLLLYGDSVKLYIIRYTYQFNTLRDSALRANNRT